jgi:hypothetical protein
VERIESFKFLGVHNTKYLSWSKYTNTVVKRARQRPLRRLKIFGMGPQIFKKFDSCTIEITLTGCINAWYDNCLASGRKALQGVVRTAQYITGAESFLSYEAVSEEGTIHTHIQHAHTCILMPYTRFHTYHKPQEVGRTSIGEDGLVVMVEAESDE